MEPMMDGAMVCGVPMMIGMAVVATLLVVTLVLTSAAAIRYLRTDRAPDHHAGTR